MGRFSPKNSENLGSWDCAIAVLMLGITPIAIHYVFGDRGDYKELIPMVAGVCVAALAVFLLVALTGWRIIGKIVNILGIILTIIYIVIAIQEWRSADHYRNSQEEGTEKP